MADSYAKKVKDLCHKLNIELEDYSSLSKYAVRLKAPQGQLLLFVEENEYRISRVRQKGGRKEPFWSRVFEVVEGGLVSAEEWQRMDASYRREKEKGRLNPESTHDTYVKGWFTGVTPV